MTKTTFAQKLLLLIRSRGISQVDLAERIGAAPSHLNHYLKGHGDIRSSMLLEILSELGIDLEKIVLDEVAKANGLLALEVPAPGKNFEILVRSLKDRQRKALVGYVQKYLQESLQPSMRPQVRQLKELC